MPRLGIDINALTPALKTMAVFRNGKVLYQKTVVLWALCAGSKVYGLIAGKGGLSVAENHPDFEGYIDSRN